MLDVAANLSASVEVFYGVRNSSVCDLPLVDAARRIVDAGFGVEILTAQGWDDRTLPDDKLIEAIAEIAESTALMTTHACVNTWAPDVLRKEILITQRMGIKQMVIHPYVLGFNVEGHEPSAQAARDLCHFAQDCGILLVLENLGKMGMPWLKRVLDAVGWDIKSSGLGVCIDVGHAHRSCSEDGIRPEAFLQEFRDIIREVHVDDNLGHKDLHLPPGHGTIEWGAVMDAMVELPAETIVCLEIAWPAHPIKALRESRDFLLSVIEERKPAKDR
ncbi:MAG: sugar phosphate isomerase/epimerase [Armatimonadetes bacterium]|nr:sugar phosphate isomerase/epimerase [Armatimonadota bacterium]